MSDVVVDRVRRTCVIAINRPEARNALTRGVLATMRDALHAAASDHEVRVVVVTGQGGHFCAGADLRKNLEDPEMMDKLDAYLDDFHSVIKAIVRCPKPTIAMMDGAAVGFGADIALACDLRVATTAAYVQEKFVKIGLMPDGGGTFWLPHLVGLSRALRMILLAEKVDGQTMLDLGLLVKLVSPPQLREATMALAVEIAKGPPLAYAAIKSAVYASSGSIDDALKREREGQLKLLRSADCLEGITAWAQKRDPDFQGR